VRPDILNDDAETNPDRRDEADLTLSGGGCYPSHRGGRGHEQGERVVSLTRRESKRTDECRYHRRTDIGEHITQNFVEGLSRQMNWSPQTEDTRSSLWFS
jgi:hypothetical protein